MIYSWFKNKNIVGRTKYVLILSILIFVCAGMSNSAQSLERFVPVGTTWHWQLDGTVEPENNGIVYVVDLFDTPLATIELLQSQENKIVCYFSAGSFEDWRTDVDKFTNDVLGNDLGDWPGEKWIDIRSSAIRDIMATRIVVAAEKKCDAVAPSNVNVATRDTGFEISSTEQIKYNLFLSKTARDNKLFIGLVNSLLQINQLSEQYDFAINSSCMEYNECDYLLPFLEQEKPVFHAEYSEDYLKDNDAFLRLCSKSNEFGLSSIVVSIDLDGKYRLACP